MAAAALAELAGLAVLAGLLPVLLAELLELHAARVAAAPSTSAAAATWLLDVKRVTGNSSSSGSVYTPRSAEAGAGTPETARSVVRPPGRALSRATVMHLN